MKVTVPEFSSALNLKVGIAVIPLGVVPLTLTLLIVKGVGSGIGSTGVTGGVVVDVPKFVTNLIVTVLLV